MPQKTLNVLAAVAGLLVVAAIALLGFDIYRAAKAGPRWKRRLVSAGLGLFAALAPFDWGSRAEAGHAGRPAQGRPTGRAASYDQTAEWQRLVAIWREASEIASGKRGAYPFDRAGRQRVLDALAAAGPDLGTLQQAGLLSAAEVGLLREDLAQLTRGVQAKRPTEMRMATCYRPAYIDPGRESLQRLSARLPFLEALATSGRLHPEVVRRALASIERDVATLGDPQRLRRLSEAGRARAAEVRAAAARHVQRLRARLDGVQGETGARGPAAPAADTALTASPHWRTVTAAWAAALPLARSGRSTMAQRKQATQRLSAAKAAIATLAEASLLAPQEAQLLTDELAFMRHDIFRNPPTDLQITCYDMAFVPPARDSLERLARRLPFVERLTAGGILHRAACARIITGIEADIAVLSDARKLAQLPKPQRAGARATRERAETLLARLRRRLAPPRILCYRPAIPPGRRPQSRRTLDERRRLVESFEAEGTLRPAVAALLRQAIEAGQDA